jgi:hypothetical protein
MMVPIEQSMDAVVPEVLAATAECESGFADYPSQRFPWGGDYIGAVIVPETRATRRARVVVAWPVRQDTVYRVTAVARTLR